MSEAPKKVWYDSDLARLVNEQGLENDIPYIRADIVDELVEALKDLIDAWEAGDDIDGLAYINAEAALAKLEESRE